MDPVEDIKARLPIEELVGQYRALQKKGRNFVCLCPFHNDTHPSMVVSPDKGIAYCFACNSGGDIFSFYQRIESVDFRQALHDLAERTGVELPRQSEAAVVPKDEKERLRSCLQAAEKFFREQLASSTAAREYLAKRLIPVEQIEEFGIGYAPDSFSATYEHLLREGFSKSEILAVGLGVQKDLAQGKIYDRFRNRITFPIHDQQGRIAGFGGRTIGDDDAKYINSSEGPLYRKSEILFGLHRAKDAIRETGNVVMVEGYFDLLACHRVGVRNAVAVSGTALTEQHVRILKRSCPAVVLCLDQDRAGRDASERAYHLCSAEGMSVHAVVLQHKDPDEAANANPEGLKSALTEGSVPFLSLVLADMRARGIALPDEKREAAQRLLPLIRALPMAVEREHYLREAAVVLGTTETALREDMERVSHVPIRPLQKQPEAESPLSSLPGFSHVEVALGLFLLYPQHRSFLGELIEPEEGFTLRLYRALKAVPEGESVSAETVDLPQEDRERAAILQLFCEEHEFGRWSENLARREIRKNCAQANRAVLRQKQAEIKTKLLDAHRAGRSAEEQQLSTQYQQLLKLSQMTM